ncbi:iron-containing alcohol dehydrogenase family protein [Pectobacteriaceae bacterium C52]|uniref:Oxidoreductase n=1 Tax=Serratia sp. (strain ATCC 39006) TaxID=104623 RepID=A0A2I5TII3_SERS3|nr:iron-containing alcohol dehydrogenase family protein [Serratia sp. ATCC 39006]AUH00056.1 oxidoreductase [Serratia sp. ATCC 39006]AUH04375.1 oxidoreductase [Serratia sp. ATCC 39006]WJV61442.1 iron-containing alcohol dehydrogenase family protein [Pectobacteriaceae bacterium C52]
MTQQVFFPATVLRGAGVSQQLGTLCARLGTRVLVVGGRKALAATEALIRGQLQQADVELAAEEWSGGHCSISQIERLCERVRATGSDVLLAVGGGKALDTGKAVAFQCAIPVVTLPTIAATCAAVTPLSVRYHDDGHFHDLYHLSVAPAAVVIDSGLLARAPLRWLAAGLGDTLAKWYEFRAIDTGRNDSGFAASSRANSEICFQLINRYGAEACQAVNAGKSSDALDQVLDAIFLFAGLTSLMASGAHAAASHALYEGFTACDKTREFGHGLLVGFGNLCLLALEQRSDDELLEAIRLARVCAVPLALADICPDLTEDELKTIVRASVVAPDMANLPFSVTEDMIHQAIHRVEALAERAIAG